jgi:hypothetical protein
MNEVDVGAWNATWGTAYRLLGALPDTKSAILYSVSALTSYGHASLFLEAQWQPMGALERQNDETLRPAGRCGEFQRD